MQEKKINITPNYLIKLRSCKLACLTLVIFLSLSGIYTGEKTLHVVAVASDGDLKRWEDFY
jgi:hypothetical protein